MFQNKQEKKFQIKKLFQRFIRKLFETLVRYMILLYFAYANIYKISIERDKHEISNTKITIFE